MSELLDLVECSVCLDRFTQPKMLPCQHTFCLHCIRRVAGDHLNLNCPKCRARCRVPHEGVEGFKDSLVIKNLLDIVGERVECTDCGKKQLNLSDCEHCQQKVCADCRVSHNLLQVEIGTLVDSIQNDTLGRTADAHFMATLNTSFNQTQVAQTKVEEAFSEAIATLNVRKEQILTQIRTVGTFQKLGVEGRKELAVQPIRRAMAGCKSSKKLRRLRGSLTAVKRMLDASMTRGGMEFSYDLSEVARFGQIHCGGETFAVQPIWWR